MSNIIIKKKCLIFKHGKNNQTLSNDWPTYCHMRILSMETNFSYNHTIQHYVIKFNIVQSGIKRHKPII